MIDFAADTPKARSLDEIIEALEISVNELSFQQRRLREHVRPRTESEAAYHAELAAGYKHAAFMLRTLLNYQKGRRDNMGQGQADGFEAEDAIDSKGRATPYADDEGAPA